MKTETTPSPPTVASADLLDAARIQERESYERLLEHEGKQEAASLKSHMYMIWLDDYKRLGDEWIAAFRAYRDQIKSASNKRVMRCGPALRRNSLTFNDLQDRK